MHYVDVPMGKVREIAMRLQRGGVGYYPTSGTPFVHLDVGSVRAWPRMSYDQLARLFPDGKTVHLPSNGQPLARYEEARAEIDARGESPVMVARAQSGSGKGFFSKLFGSGEDDEDTGAVATPRGRTRVARATSADKDDAGAIQTPSERRAADRLARAERNLPRGETTMGAPASSTAAPVQVAAISITPPPRPAGLGAPLAAPALANQQVAFASMPLPPVRPSALVGVTTVERAIGPLPEVIRPSAEPPLAVLAYAPQSPDSIALRASLLPSPSASALQRAAEPARTRFYAARLDQTNFALLTQTAALSGALATKDLGMRPGLRAAVKAEGRAVALQGSLLATTQYRDMLAELRTDRFTGPAVRMASLTMDAPSDLH
jgi:hypothetical protein